MLIFEILHHLISFMEQTTNFAMVIWGKIWEISHRKRSIQAFGRVGRSNAIQDYSIRLQR